MSNRDLALRSLVRDADAFATTLLVIAVDRLADVCPPDKPYEWTTWHPSTIRAEFERAVGTRVPDASFDRLMAAVSIVTTDLFFREVRAFIDVANVLCGDDAGSGVFDPADSAECAWAVTEALLLDPPDAENPEPFSDDVRYYIGSVLKEEGYVTPPDVLRIALGTSGTSPAESYADDPELFSALYQNQHAKTAEIEDLMRDGITELVEQLSSLRLEHGDTGRLIERLRRTLRERDGAENLH